MSDDHEKLSHCLNRILYSQDDVDGITLNNIFSQVGNKGFGMILAVMAIPSALPVPAIGYSTLFGILVATISLQMIFGRSTPWLPNRLKEIKLPRKPFGVIVHTTNLFFSRFEYLIKPRMHWIGSRLGLPLIGLLVFIMACLMIFPIPLTNTPPAIVIFAVGVGLSENDGILTGLACILGIFALILYTYVIYLIIIVGMNGMEKMFGFTY